MTQVQVIVALEDQKVCWRGLRLRIRMMKAVDEDITMIEQYQATASRSTKIFR